MGERTDAAVNGKSGKEEKLDRGDGGGARELCREGSDRERREERGPCHEYNRLYRCLNIP